METLDIFTKEATSIFLLLFDKSREKSNVHGFGSAMPMDQAGAVLSPVINPQKLNDDTFCDQGRIYKNRFEYFSVFMTVCRDFFNSFQSKLDTWMWELRGGVCGVL